MAIVALTHNLQKYWIVHQAVPRTVSFTIIIIIIIIITIIIMIIIIMIIIQESYTESTQWLKTLNYSHT